MVVSGFANNLIGSKIASATIQIGVPSNSEKKNTVVAAVIWFFEEYLYLLSTDTFYKYCDVDCQLPIVADVDIFCFIFPTTNTVR